MTSQLDVIDELPTAPLRIERVITPEPHYGSGTYEVRLQLSQPMTSFEVQALREVRRGMHAVASGAHRLRQHAGADRGPGG